MNLGSSIREYESGSEDEPISGVQGYYGIVDDKKEECVKKTIGKIGGFVFVQTKAPPKRMLMNDDHDDHDDHDLLATTTTLTTIAGKNVINNIGNDNNSDTLIGNNNNNNDNNNSNNNSYINNTINNGKDNNFGIGNLHGNLNEEKNEKSETETGIIGINGYDNRNGSMEGALQELAMVLYAAQNPNAIYALQQCGKIIENIDQMIAEMIAPTKYNKRLMVKHYQTFFEYAVSDVHLCNIGLWTINYFNTIIKYVPPRKGNFIFNIGNERVECTVCTLNKSKIAAIWAAEDGIKWCQNHSAWEQNIKSHYQRLGKIITFKNHILALEKVIWEYEAIMTHRPQY